MDDVRSAGSVSGGLVPDAGASASLPTLGGHPVVLATGDAAALERATGRALTWGLPLVIDLSSAPAPAPAPLLAAALRALARASGVVPIVAVGDPGPPGAAVAAMADVVCASSEEAARVLGFLPPNALTDPPAIAGSAPALPGDALDALDALVPDVPDLPFDVTTVLDAALDAGALPVGGSGRPLRTLLARVEGAPVGVVAVDPAQRQGMPASADARAAARFVAWCDAFGLPVLTLLDVPDALDPLAESDPAAAAALAHSYGAATSGLVTVVLRRAHGLTAALLGLPGCGADVTLVWPGALPPLTPGPDVVVLERPALTRAEVAAALALARRRRDTPPPRRRAVPPR